jgi:hypothetical protein
MIRDDENFDAVLFEIAGEDVWIPRSQMTGGQYREGEYRDGSFEVPEWLAIEKGLV